MKIMQTLAAAAALWAAAVSGGEWPGFRGDGTSHAPAGGYPVRWSPAENIAWAADLPGYGQSAPAVAGGVVYVLAVEGPNKETNHILAFDAATGGRRWTHSFPSSATAKNTPMVGRAAPTPAVDGDGVYAFFESGDLIALTAEGKARWRRSLTKEYGPFTNRHGLGSSPAQSSDALFLLVDQEAGGYLLAVSKRTGETLWKADRPDRTGWSSPTVAELCGVTQVVVSSGGAVDGYDVATGERLWTQEGLTGNSVPSPAVAGDRVYVGARLGRRGGNVSAVSRSNRCLRVRREGETFVAETAWEAEKIASHYASPLLLGDSVYYANNVGVLFRLDAGTGGLVERVRAGRPCWATPIAADSRIYLFGDDGTTTVFEAGGQLAEAATNRLWDDAGAPAGDPYAADVAERERERAGSAQAGLDPGRPIRDSTEREGAGSGSTADAEYDRPTVYGVAAADGGFFIRTGTRLYCVRDRRE